MLSKDNLKFSALTLPSLFRFMFHSRLTLAFQMSPIKVSGSKFSKLNFSRKMAKRVRCCVFFFATHALGAEYLEVSVDVNEGTWLNLDVSPDGTELVFDLLGDIYRLPIKGGEARSITSGMAWDMQPRFSPDGKRIAFTSDQGGANNIWTIEREGINPTQVTSESFRLVNNPSWSADGRFIAARKHFTTERSLGTGEIWLYHLSGGSGIPIVEKPGKNHQKELGEPAFSADGRYLYYSQDTTPGPTFKYAQDSNRQIFQIFQYDLQSRESRSVVSGAGGAVRPTPSPDGRYLAFVRRIRSRSALFLKDLTNGKETLLFESLDQDLQEIWAIHGVYPNMDWLPNSRTVVFWAGGHIRTIDIETLKTGLIPFHVKASRMVEQHIRPRVQVAPEQVSIKMIRNAAVSPDGSRVVFEAAGKLYIKRLSDGGIKALTQDSEKHFELQPSWSRDSRKIVFASWDDDALGQIRMVSRDGGHSKVLTSEPGHYRNPRFSPDMKKIVFRAGRGGYLVSPAWSENPGIYVMSSKGGKQTFITNAGRSAHFGKQNDRIFVTRKVDDGIKLLSMDLSGNNEIEHARSTAATQFVVSPDEHYLAFREAFHIYATPFPDSGKPMQVSSQNSGLITIKVSKDGGDYPGWSEEGRSLHWTLGASLFSTSVNGVFKTFASDTEKYEQLRISQSGLPLELHLQADKPLGKIALVGARILTMSESAEAVIEHGSIILEGNRIAAIGAESDIEIPADALVINLSGKTVMPGLIDAHAHGAQGSEVTPEQNWISHATLALGVTTIHDPGNVSAEIFPAAEMQRLGRILGPRIFSAGNVLYGARSSSLYAAVDSPKDALEHVRRLKAQGALSIKNYNQPRREQRQQIAAAARQEGMLVVAEGASLIDLDLSLIVDGNAGIEHNLPQSMLYDDVIQFWSQTGVSYTPTLVVSFGGLSAEQFWYQESDVWLHPVLKKYVPPHILQPRAVRRQKAPLADYHHLRTAKMSKRMADSGVRVNVGGHGQREGLASHWEMWSLVQGGMSAEQALRAATINAATHLGLDADIGSLETGKLADMIVLTSDPLVNIRNSDSVELIIQNGRVYDAMTLNERFSGNRKTQPFYWQ